MVLVRSDGLHLEFSGAADTTTNNRMEITAAIEALRKLPPSIELTIRTDSQYLVKTMTLGWKRRENIDLWQKLDAEVAQRQVRWEWVRGHAGDALNERADELARNAALGNPQTPSIDSLNQLGVTLAAKPQTLSRGRGEHPSEQQPAVERSAAIDDEESVADGETEIARLLRPVLATGETLRRCANCHRAFVATGNPPRMRAYCSLAECQLKRRTN